MGAHTAKKRSSCPHKIAIDWCDSHGHPHGGGSMGATQEVTDDMWGDCLTKCEDDPSCYTWTLKYDWHDYEPNCYLKDNCDWPHEADDHGNGGGGPDNNMFNGISGFIDYQGWGDTGACEIQFADSGYMPPETELWPNPKDWQHCVLECRNAGEGTCKSWTFKYSEGRCFAKSKELPEYYTCSKDVISGAPAAPGYNGKSLANGT